MRIHSQTIYDVVPSKPNKTQAPPLRHGCAKLQHQRSNMTYILHWPLYLLIICLSPWCNALHVSPLWYHKPMSPSIQLKSSMTEFSERDTLSTNISLASSRLDPLLLSFLMRTVHDVEDGDMASYFRLHDAHKAMLGLSTWETSLRKGRIPITSDFTQEMLWPEEPLFTSVYESLSQLALARLVKRHPEVMTSVLLAVVKVVVEFITLERRGVMVVKDEYEIIDEEYSIENDLTLQDDDSEQYDIEYVPLSDEELERLAQSLSNELTQEWSGVVRGMSMLDSLFGYNHQLLDLKVRLNDINSIVHDQPILTLCASL